jgi:hypothetical protein
VIKHGIKASGMPAGAAWTMSSSGTCRPFLQKLPTLDKAGYKALVASSDGLHGGGETQGHHDDEKAEDHPALFEPGNNSMPMRTCRAWTTITTARHPATRKSGW